MSNLHSVDLAYWVDVVIKAGTMSAALYGLWRVWLRPVQRWFQHQGEMNIQIASVVAEQLPKMTKAIEAVSAIQVTHDRDINDLRGRVTRLEGAAPTDAQQIPMIPRATR